MSEIIELSQIIESMQVAKETALNIMEKVIQTTGSTQPSVNSTVLPGLKFIESDLASQATVSYNRVETSISKAPTLSTFALEATKTIRKVTEQIITSVPTLTPVSHFSAVETNHFKKSALSSGFSSPKMINTATKSSKIVLNLSLEIIIIILLAFISLILFGSLLSFLCKRIKLIILAKDDNSNISSDSRENEERLNQPASTVIKRKEFIVINI